MLQLSSIEHPLRNLQTSSILLVFLLDMFLHLQVQTKAQEEIDRVVGNKHFAEISDGYNLPYIEAVLLETLR